MDPAGMRTSYDLDSLAEASAADEPMRQFDAWFAQAVAVNELEANAMTLATAGPDGRPSTRIVLLKGYDAAGLVFFTNYESRKARDLAAQPWAALQFFWPSLQRVVRIEGPVEQVSTAESDEYFASRPLGHRLGAWASPQSEVIADREVLIEAEAEASARFGEHPPRPPHWGGYRLLPQVWEFWQGRPSRLHDRLRYRLDDGRWLRERLAP